jgi:hypothetical protein
MPIHWLFRGKILHTIPPYGKIFSNKLKKFVQAIVLNITMSILPLISYVAIYIVTKYYISIEINKAITIGKVIT